MDGRYGTINGMETRTTGNAERSIAGLVVISSSSPGKPGLRDRLAALVSGEIPELCAAVSQSYGFSGTRRQVIEVVAWDIGVKKLLLKVCGSRVALDEGPCYVAADFRHRQRGCTSRFIGSLSPGCGRREDSQEEHVFLVSQALNRAQLLRETLNISYVEPKVGHSDPRPLRLICPFGPC